MKLYDQIKVFEPFNEQEETDRKRLLEYLETGKDLFTRKNENAHMTAGQDLLTSLERRHC
jgi:hypothetical protein